MRMLDRVTSAVVALASPAVTVGSLLISIASLYVAYDGAKSSNTLAAQALATARQANEIALGRIREPSILQFSGSDENNYKFNFTSTTDLERELHPSVYLTNDGKKAVEGAVFEVVGIEPLTYRVDDPSISVKQLPSIILTATFNSAVQPGGAVHFDIKKMVLQYLAKLATQITDKNATYNTVVNVVITPKGLGEAVAVGAPTKFSPRDREILTIVFKANVLDSEVAKKILSEPYVPNRVFSP
jgi:hypothetical protein